MILKGFIHRMYPLQKMAAYIKQSNTANIW